MSTRLLIATSARMPNPFGDADNHYAFIHSWWLSSRAAFEVGVHKLNNWLSFWHFRV